jgi:hypothetical protein
VSKKAALRIIEFKKTIPERPPGSRNGKRMEAEDVRFWRMVQVGGVDDCWPWMGAVDRYGRFSVNGRTIGAHCAAFRLAVRKTRLFVCHTCDNPPCCNPAHLYAGTALDNKADSVRRNRLNPRRGELCHWARLSEPDVRAMREMRSAGATLQAIADKFRVSSATAFRTVSKKTWSHVK